ncbi:hypothetical protein Tsubulata_013924 [Turnera subulata]|uniref:Uncharacterized protein n=1 Tax=Turnera subulata TaxID=218843 RepID=A0A9Q0JEQ2_9ROSI|nr:hypothetical protein Tsubulata_013924 [Turnera subulata]
MSFCFPSTPTKLGTTVGCFVAGAALFGVGLHLAYANVAPQQARIKARRERARIGGILNSRQRQRQLQRRAEAVVTAQASSLILGARVIDWWNGGEEVQCEPLDDGNGKVGKQGSDRGEQGQMNWWGCGYSLRQWQWRVDVLMMVLLHATVLRVGGAGDWREKGKDEEVVATVLPLWVGTGARKVEDEQYRRCGDALIAWVVGCSGVDGGSDLQ